MARVRAFAFLLVTAVFLSLFSGFIQAQTLGSIISDDFSGGSLNENIWYYVDPYNDTRFDFVGTGTEDAWLSISVPAGLSHNIWTTGINVPRVMQNIRDEDFEVEVKFQSALTQRTQLQGVLVQQDDANFLDFSFYSDGISTRLFIASFIDGAPTVPVIQDRVIAEAGVEQMYLRIAHYTETKQWITLYSLDGENWAESVIFEHPMAVNAVGVFGGNSANATETAPAHKANIDYFYNTASPKSSEDPVSSFGRQDNIPPAMADVRFFADQESILLTWLANEPAAGILRYGTTTSYEIDSMLVGDLRFYHSLLVSGLEPDTTYHFQVSMIDGSNNFGDSDDFAITTAAAPVPPELDVWYGARQTFGRPFIPQRWVNIFGNVATADSDLVSLDYALNGSDPVSLVVGPDGQRLAALGDFNVDLAYSSLFAGDNELVLTATDSQGNVSAETVTVVNNADLWAQESTVTYLEDSCRGLTLTDQLSLSATAMYDIDWNAVDSISDVAQVIDGKWELTNEGAYVVEPGYDRLIGIGDIDWQDYEVVVPFIVYDIEPSGSDFISGADPLLGVILRWQGHYLIGDNRPATGWQQLGVFGQYVEHGRGTISTFFDLQAGAGDQGSLARSSEVGLVYGLRYFLKMRVSTTISGESFYSLKVWQDGQDEPENWLLTAERNDGLDQGAFLLVAHHVQVAFGNVEVTVSGGGANSQPEQPEEPVDCSVRSQFDADLYRRPDLGADVYGKQRAGQEFRVDRQYRDANGLVWLHLAPFE